MSRVVIGAHYCAHPRAVVWTPTDAHDEPLNRWCPDCYTPLHGATPEPTRELDLALGAVLVHGLTGYELADAEAAIRRRLSGRGRA